MSMRFQFSFFAVLSLLWLPSVANAGPVCEGQSGVCMSIGQCTQFKQQYLGTVDLGPSDCGDPALNTCCRAPKAPPAPPQLPAPTPVASCSTQGGHCTSFCSGKEQDLGSLDCPDVQTCCKLPTSAPASTPTPLGGAASPSAGSGVAAPPGTLWAAIPEDIRGRIQTGDVTLNDIVNTGIAFGYFIMGLSGALFFMVFIYGGAMYLLSFGDKARVDKGKAAVKGAAIGIVIVMGAWTIVSYIVAGLKGTSVGGGPVAPATPGSACLQKGPQWKCTTLQGVTAQDVSQNAASQNLQCAQQLCPGDFHTLCCSPKS